MKIHTIRLGLDYCYLIQDEETIMVDGGSPNQAKEFTRALAKIGVKPEAIRLLVITHGHFDHIGSARDIKEITGAKLAMHEREKDWLGNLDAPASRGHPWGKIFHGVLKLFLPLIHIPAATVDIILGDKETVPERIWDPGESNSHPGALLRVGQHPIGQRRGLRRGLGHEQVSFATRLRVCPFLPRIYPG